MPEISWSIEIDASQEAIWRVLMALDSWPEWSPLFQAIRMNDPASGTAGGFHLQGLLGRIPYSGEFMVPDYRPLERFIFESVTISPPYDVLWHDVSLHGSVLTWSIVYEMAGGPGGWLIDRTMIRRPGEGLLERGLRAFADRVTHVPSARRE